MVVIRLVFFSYLTSACSCWCCSAYTQIQTLQVFSRTNEQFTCYVLSWVQVRNSSLAISVFVCSFERVHLCFWVCGVVTVNILWGFVSAPNWCRSVAASRYHKVTSPIGKHCTSQIGLTAVPWQGLFGLGAMVIVTMWSRENDRLVTQTQKHLRGASRWCECLSELIQTNRLSKMFRWLHTQKKTTCEAFSLLLVSMEMK